MFLLPLHVTSVTADRLGPARQHLLQRAAEARASADEALLRDGMTAVLVITCHRIELISWGDADGADWLQRWLLAIGAPCDAVALATVSADLAVRHVISLIAGSLSPIRGEIDVQVQVRRAWQRARDVGTTSAAFDDVMSRALAAARRLRLATRGSAPPRSLGGEVVNRLTARGSWAQDSVLVVGTGDAAMSVLQALHRAPRPAQVAIIGRTPERVGVLAEQFACASHGWASLHDAVRSSTAVVFAVSTPAPVLHASGLLPTGVAGVALPLWIDLGVPATVDVVGADDRVEYIGMADFADREPAPVATGRDDARALQQELARFAADLQRRNQSAAISELQELAQTIAVQEAARAAASLSSGQERHEQDLVALGHRIVQRLLHPIVQTLTHGTVPVAVSQSLAPAREPIPERVEL